MVYYTNTKIFPLNLNNSRKYFPSCKLSAKNFRLTTRAQQSARETKAGSNAHAHSRRSCCIAAQPHSSRSKTRTPHPLDVIKLFIVNQLFFKFSALYLSGLFILISEHSKRFLRVNKFKRVIPRSVQLY